MKLTPISIGFIGGLGDVCKRKFNSLEGNENFRISAIADKYPEDDFHTLEKARLKITELSKRRPDKPIEQKLIEFLSRSISSGQIKYFHIDKEIPNDFFSYITGGIIDISSPNKYHLGNLNQCINRGARIIEVEKPVIHTEEDLPELSKTISKLSNSEELICIDHYLYYENLWSYISRLSAFSRNSVRGGLGKIKSLDLFLEEAESFNERNLGIIKKKESGGGIWIDLGIHTISFLHSINAIPDLKETIVKFEKGNLPEGTLNKEDYGETRASVYGRIIPQEGFSNNCTYNISVGKSMPQTRKQFIMSYDNGKVIVDMKEKSLAIQDAIGKEFYRMNSHSDPFSNLYNDLLKRIQNKENVRLRNSPKQAQATMKTLFSIYSKS